MKNDLQTLFRDGICVERSAFDRAFVSTLHDDMMSAFWKAIQRPGSAIARGPRRWYVEVHPQAISGFVQIATHPWIVSMAETVLGPNYEIVEIGLDVPFQGAQDQPWHRDFPSPLDTYEKKQITSLAFNLTGVDVSPDMGPFEIAMGTHWDDGKEWRDEMFPPEKTFPSYFERAIRAYPKMGDVSCRSALTIHRGTIHNSPIPRPVLVLGLDAPGAGNAALHDLMVTRAYYNSLPENLKKHLNCRVVDELEVIKQKHGIAGLDAPLY